MVQRDERDSVTGTRAKGRPDEQLSAPSRSHLDGPRPADAGSGLLPSEQSDMRPFELFYIGERVVITGPVKSFPARRFNGPEQSYGITGVIASSGGPSGHSVQLDTGRLVGAPIGSISRSASRQAYGLRKLTGGIAKREREAWERIANGCYCHAARCHAPASVLVQNAVGMLYPACRAHGEQGRSLGYSVLERD